ncbi:MAG: hypothetical protein IPP63_19115 [Chloracidobacterium sp.]|nr:hypothetical protein [Chloracidobacterium sp.]
MVEYEPDAHPAPKPAMGAQRRHIGREEDTYQESESPSRSEKADNAAKTGQGGALNEELKQKISLCFAPMAFRMPISRVRSVTDTSMIFITPIPPIIKPTEEITTMARKTPPVIAEKLIDKAGCGLHCEVILVPKFNLPPSSQKVTEYHLSPFSNWPSRATARINRSSAFGLSFNAEFIAYR